MNVLAERFIEDGYKINGVIQIGAGDGYELQWYRELGIEHYMGFEPVKDVYRRFIQNYPELKTGKEFIFNIALSDQDLGSTPIRATLGDGQGSSLLEPTPEYLEEHPEYANFYTDFVNVKRFYTVMKDWGTAIDVRNNFDLLVVDTQGTEFEAMDGMSHYLSYMKYIIVELSEKPVYKGGKDAALVCDYLKKHGYHRLNNIGHHSDVYFIREDLFND